jgi:hypothetical protein
MALKDEADEMRNASLRCPASPAYRHGWLELQRLERERERERETLSSARGGGLSHRPGADVKLFCILHHFFAALLRALLAQLLIAYGRGLSRANRPWPQMWPLYRWRSLWRRPQTRLASKQFRRVLSTRFAVIGNSAVITS